MPIAPGTHVLYTVRAGDTLYRIADQFGASLETLIQANAWYPPVSEPDRLYPGQLLLVRLPGMSQQSAVLYQVAAGDTLYRISERFTVGVDLLAGLNRLPDPNDLRVAQLLSVPAFVYEVEPGDTLYRISRRFGVPLGELIRANRGRPGLSPDVVYPGFRLVVPLPTSTNIVVFQPLPGMRIASGTPLMGVARVFEANVLYQIRDAADRPVARERFVTASEGAPAFGSFETQLQLDVPPATPSGTLMVYSRSAKDGSIQDLVEAPVLF